MKYASGQSITEALVALAVLVPLILVVVSFANLLSASSSGTQAGRFAAWQRTVYQQGMSGIGQAQIETRITNNIKRIYMEDKPRIDMAQGRSGDNVTDRPLVMDLDDEVALVMSESRVDHLDGLQNKNTRIARCIYRGLTTHTDSCNSGVGTALDRPTIVSPVVSIPIDKDFSLFKLMEAAGMAGNTYQDTGTPPSDRVSGTSRYSVTGQAALLTVGSWTPATPEDLDNAVSSAALDGRTLQAFEGSRFSLGMLVSGNWMGSWVGSVILGLKEMSWLTDSSGSVTADGHSTVAENQADILPPGMGTFP